MTRKEIEIEILKKAEKMIYDRERQLQRQPSHSTSYLCGMREAEILIAGLRNKLK